MLKSLLDPVSFSASGAVALLVASLFGGCASHAAAQVVVYTASPGGIMAAVQAARGGAEVTLVEPTAYVGGIVAQGGLVLSDLGDETTIGGLARDFFRRVDRHYADTYGPDSPQRAHTRFQGYPGGCFEPRVAETIFERCLAEEPRITVIRNAPLMAVDKQGAAIRSIQVQGPDGPRTIAGRIFIDASYTGDLLAQAGVEFRIGREAQSQTGETLARKNADAAIQAYNYRLTLTDDPANRIPIERPDGYDPAVYDEQLQHILKNKPWRLENIFRPYWRLPNRKQDTNVADLAGRNHDYPQAPDEQRRRIEQAHRDFSLGYIYFLQNDPRVPEEIRVPARQWGLPADEFADNGHFPRQIYVREARRMVGEYLMRQQDLQQERHKPDGIALGSYAIDSHAVKTYREDGVLKRDGYLFVPVKPYAIPYRALLPQRHQADNLLVPVVMSATHIAWASMRMEPVFMMTGQAAGEAAALSLRSGKPLHEIDIRVLRQALIDAGALVDVPAEPIAAFTWEPRRPAVGQSVQFRYRQTQGAVEPAAIAWDFDGDGRVDSREREPSVTFHAAKRTLVSLIVRDAAGRWSTPVAEAIEVAGETAGDQQLDSEDAPAKTHDVRESINQQPYWGTSFHHDGNERKGRAGATYPFTIQKTGRYTLYISTTAPGGRSTNTPVTIDYGGRSTTVRLNQNELDNPFGLVAVGDYEFAAGEAVVVRLSNDGTDNYTIFDLVRLVYRP